MTEITASDAQLTYGIVAAHEIMPWGELRFRLRASDGNAYIRTQATTSGWQTSHYHLRTFETYIVEKGWMGFATLGNDRDRPLDVVKLLEQAVITTPLGAAHNVYLPAGALIHTVKHGASSAEADWHAAPSLDEQIELHGTRLLGLA